jgi:predicted kinase
MGIPGSGKTTWANLKRDAVVVSRDEVGKELGQPCGSDFVRYECQARVREHLMRGTNCIYDWPNVYREMRRPYIELIREHAARGVLVVFEVDPEEAWTRLVEQGRNSLRLRATLKAQHKAMDQALHDVAYEGWDDILFVT